MDILILAFLWTAWCFLHSAMISVSVTEYLKERLGDSYRFYRLVYVIVAVVTLLPVHIFSNSVQSPDVFSWKGPLVVLRMLLVNVILTAYLLTGTVLEERKLVLEFGDEYKEYQKKVSMFLPAKWVRSRLIG